MASTGGQNEAILNSNNLSVAKFNSCVSSVCQLALSIGNSIEGKASGFLAKFTLDGNQKIVVVMNNHFVASKEDASRVVATFEFEEGKDKLKMVELDPDIFFRTNQELDYTFVGISQRDVNELREKHGVTPVKLNQTRLAVDVDDVIHIPQHPDGRQKRISFSTVCMITDSEVFYKADTSFGSSGSPILYSQSNDMHVLALHKDGGVILRDGKLANRGILISAILDHICRQSENDERPADVNDRASSIGKPESGAYVDGPTTSQGLPILQTQSEENVPNSDTPSPSSNQPSYLVKETGSPSSNTPHSQSSKFPAVFVQPSRDVRGPPANWRNHAVCPQPFETKELIRIAQRISDVWLLVAKHTGSFKDWEIANITCNYTLSNPTLKADQMLTAFKSRLGKREVLADAIKESGKRDVANKVRSGFYIYSTD